MPVEITLYLHRSQSTNAYGSSFTLPNALTRTGYTFLGWELGSGASANLYAPAGTFHNGIICDYIHRQVERIKLRDCLLRLTVVLVQRQLKQMLHITKVLQQQQRQQDLDLLLRVGAMEQQRQVLQRAFQMSLQTRHLRHNGQLQLPGVPGTPTATPGNGSATITITPPSSGGTPSSYTVTALQHRQVGQLVP